MTSDALSREALTCRDLDACLHPFVDNELEPEDRAGLEQHLFECTRCCLEVEALRGYKRMLRASHLAERSEPQAPDPLRARLCDAIAEESSRQRRRARRPYFVWPMAAAALAVGALFLVQSIRERGQTQDIVAAAIENHQRDLPLEVHESAIPNIRSWFAGKVAFTPNGIPDLGKTGAVGARLSHLKDRDAAYVVYGAPNQRRVSLFVFDAPGLALSNRRRVADRDVMLANERGYNVAIWKDREIVYSLVSDLDERDILELVAASKR